MPGGSAADVLENMSPAERVQGEESLQNYLFAASMIPAGAAGKAAGGLVSGAGSLLPKAAQGIVPIASGAASGAAATGVLGGDPLTGAALGGAFGAFPGVVNKLAGGSNRAVADVTKGIGRKSKLKQDVKFAAREGGITDVMAELPDARRAITVKANTNPGGAAKDVGAVVSRLDDLTDADMAAIQRQHGGVPLKPIVDRLESLEKRLNLQKKGAAADTVGRIREDLLKPKRHGLDGEALTPEQLDALKISADGIREIRNTAWRAADPARTVGPKHRREANAKIAGILNKEIEDIAADTRGVNVDALRTRNRQVSKLIPVRDALLDRAEAEAERKFMTKAKQLPGKAFRRTARELDDALTESGGVPVTEVVTTGQTVGRDSERK
jgi:hypothetical protein